MRAVQVKSNVHAIVLVGVWTCLFVYSVILPIFVSMRDPNNIRYTIACVQCVCGCVRELCLCCSENCMMTVFHTDFI